MDLGSEDKNGENGVLAQYSDIKGRGQKKHEIIAAAPLIRRIMEEYHVGLKSVWERFVKEGKLSCQYHWLHRVYYEWLALETDKRTIKVAEAKAQLERMRKGKVLGKKKKNRVRKKVVRKSKV